MRFGTQTSGSPFLEGGGLERPRAQGSKMNDHSHSPSQGTRKTEQALSAGLAALTQVSLSDSDAGEIFRVATAAVGGLGPCQVEASYRSVNGEFIRFPQSQPAHRDIEWHRRSNWDGQVEAKDGRWQWAFPLRHRRTISGCFVVSAASAPSKDATQLLTICVERATHTIQWRQCQYPQR